MTDHDPGNWLRRPDPPEPAPGCAQCQELFRQLLREIQSLDEAHRMMEAQQECAWKDPMHGHHDGCPAEWQTEQMNRALKAERDRLRRSLRAVRERMQRYRSRLEDATALKEAYGRSLDEAEVVLRSTPRHHGVPECQCMSCRGWRLLDQWDGEEESDDR